MTDHTTDPSTRTAEDQTRALDVIVDIAKERCEQSSHECDWECALLERSVKTIKAELNRSKLLRSAKDHAVEQSDKHARRLIEWREAAEKATRERDAYAKAKAENDERFQLAAAEAREERDAALARVAELEGQLSEVQRIATEWLRTDAEIEEALVNVGGINRVQRWLEMTAAKACGRAIITAMKGSSDEE